MAVVSYAGKNFAPFVTCGAKSDAPDVVEFHGRRIHKAELSAATLEWLEQYHSLTPQEQLAISAVPADLYACDDAGAVEELAGE